MQGSVVAPSSGAVAVRERTKQPSHSELTLDANARLFLARHRRPLGWVLIAYVAYHLIFHVAVTGTIRYRLRVEAVLVVAAGWAASSLATARRRRLLTHR